MEAEVRIFAAAPGHAVPRTIYGHFLEHLGRCVHEGLWTERPAGPDYFLGGISRPVLEVIRSLRPGLIRYPGGCFADGYHWRDGVGPREQRRPKPNRTWRRLGRALGPEDHNHFGTDEFLALCAETGAEPMLTVNVGSGTPEEAAGWVEYCNGPAESYGGGLRAEHGRAEPWGVKYWCVGNEMWNPFEFGFCGPRTYAARLVRFSRAMRDADPEVKLVAVGAIDPWNAWNRAVLRDSEPHADYLSIHAYHPAMFFANHFLRRDRKPGPASFYWVLAGVEDFRAVLERAARAASAFSPFGRTVPLVFDEWNVWYSLGDIVRSNFGLREGIFAASVLNLLQRMAPTVPLACIAQLVNVLGVIVSDGNRAYLTPTGQVFRLYAENAGEQWLPTEVSGERVGKPGRELAALEVSATRETGGERLAVFLVNRHYDRPCAVQFELDGFAPSASATLDLVHHDDPNATNNWDEPERVTLTRRELTLASPLRLEIPPHAAACLNLNRRPESGR